jgi:hypothetical protein
MVAFLPLIPALDVEPTVAQDGNVAALDHPSDLGSSDRTLEDGSLSEAAPLGLPSCGAEQADEAVEIRDRVVDVRIDTEIGPGQSVTGHPFGFLMRRQQIA